MIIFQVEGYLRYDEDLHISLKNEPQILDSRIIDKIDIIGNPWEVNTYSEKRYLITVEEL